MKTLREIFLCDGTGMGDTLYVFKTDSPIKELKELEKISCDAYITGNGYDDVPIWQEELNKKGYVFEYVDECQHVGGYRGSDGLRDDYSHITEEYVIENQPELNKIK